MHKIIRELNRKKENDGENFREKLNDNLIIYENPLKDDKKEKVKSRANYKLPTF